MQLRVWWGTVNPPPPVGPGQRPGQDVGVNQHKEFWDLGLKTPEKKHGNLRKKNTGKYHHNYSSKS